MKKKCIWVIAAILIVAALSGIACLAINALGASVFGAFAEKPDIKEIGSAQILLVKQDYLCMKAEKGYPDTMTADDVYVEEYCGNYNGCIVIMLSDNETVYSQAIRFVNVAGVRIRYNDANEIYAWWNGEIYTLEQAYADGILSKSDIRKIRDIHNKF